MDTVDIVRGAPHRFVAQITVLDDDDGGGNSGGYEEEEKYLFENSRANTIK